MAVADDLIATDIKAYLNAQENKSLFHARPLMTANRR